MYSGKSLVWVFFSPFVFEWTPWKPNFGFKPLSAVTSAAAPEHISLRGTEGVSHTRSVPCSLSPPAQGTWGVTSLTGTQRSWTGILSSSFILQHSGWTEMMIFNNGISNPSLSPSISRSKSLPFDYAPSSLCQHMPGPREVFLTFCIG